MSQFFNSPEAVLSPACLFGSMLNYMLVELGDVETYVKSLDLEKDYVENDGEEAIEIVLKNSSRQLRMYGSARELAENVKIYRNTPGTLRYNHIGGNMFTPYNSTPVIYKSLKGVDYICKQDAYLLLQNMALEAFPFEKLQMIRVVIAMNLRSQELENLKKLEFVKFDQKTFDDINEQIKEGIDDVLDNLPESSPRISNVRTFPRLRRKIRSVVPAKWWDSNAESFEEFIIGEARRSYDPLEKEDGLIMMFNAIEGIVTVLKKIIDNRVEIFKSQKSPKTVRLFEDGDERIVMKAELMEAIGRSKKSRNNHKEEGMVVNTMNVEDVKKQYGDRIQDIEFIRTPIIRTKHRAVPIPLEFDVSFIPAADFLFEFLRHLIYGVKVFQKRNSGFLQEFPRFDVYFNPNAKDTYFLKYLTIVVLIKAVRLQLPNIRKVKAKDVRNVKADGFTVQNLKNELAYLGLLNAFPEIQNHAEIVYSEVDKNKKERFLRTCDLFDAIEHCQIICILDRLPNYKKFLHNQKACHRVYGYKCEQCENQKTSVETQKAPEQIQNAPEQNQKPPKQIQKAPEQKRIENLENKLAEMKLEIEKTIQENEILQKENQKLSIERTSNSASMTSKVPVCGKKKHIKPDTVLACTSNRIQCLICECHVDSSSKHDVIRCPLCKRRFHKKCAFEWLKEHSQCPACNGDFPKI